MFFESFVVNPKGINLVVEEEEDDKGSIPGTSVIQVSESKPDASIDTSRLFRKKSPNEKFTYIIGELRKDFTQQVKIDKTTGKLHVRARFALNSNYIFNVYAENQFGNRSLPHAIQVREHYVASPQIVMDPLPEVYLHEKDTTAQFALSQLFRDPQNLPLKYKAQIVPGTPTHGVQFTEQTLTVNYGNVTRQYTIEITASNSHKSTTLPIPVNEEFVQNPRLKKPFPETRNPLVMTPEQPKQIINLLDHFEDPPENKILIITKGLSTLTFSVTTDPPSMGDSIVLHGSQLTIKTLRKQQLFAIAVKATNPRGKTTTATFRVQDTNPTFHV